MSDYTSNPSRPGSPVGELPDIPSARPYRFNFDASRRKGPASVSETTEGRGDYFGAAPKLDLYGGSMNSLAPGSLPSEWSSTKQGFNAISTVLNNPHKKQAPPKAHSSLPSVPSTNLPRVRRKDFDSYLRAVAPEWERFERNAQLGREGAAQIDNGDGPSTPRTSTDTGGPRILPGRSIPSLDVVPAVFFDSGFNFGDPRTFDLVTEQDGSGGPGGNDPSSLSHSLPLLEKLSHYADTIEQHLVQEISLRSTSFFAALTNLHDLRSESEECLDRISKLRALLSDVDEKGAKRGLEVIRWDAKLRNWEKVRNGVKEIEEVVEMTGVAKGLVGAGRWGEALSIIEDMNSLWEAENATKKPSSSALLSPKPGRPNGTLSPLPPMAESPEPAEETTSKPSLSVPLSTLQAFSNLPSHLRTLTLDIASSLTTELVDVLRVDLGERINGNVGQGENARRDQTLRDHLRPLLQGLARTKGMREATVSWREVVLGEVRGTIKRHIPLFEIDDDDPRSPKVGSKPSGPAEFLRSMDHSDFMTLIRAVYKSLLGCVEGLQVQNDIIAEVCQTTQSPNSSIDIPSLQEELSDVLASAAELSNTRAARVVNYRSEQHAALALPEFLIFFNESWTFVVKCEVICRRMIVGLRGGVVSQAKAFLQTFHQARISQSAKLVEDEQWNPSEVTRIMQRTADILVDSAVRDSPDLVVNNDSLSTFEPPVPTPAPAALPTSPPPPNGTLSPTTSSRSKTNGSSASKHIRIEERNYFTVSATTEVLNLLVDYLRVIVNLSMLTTDTMSRVIEFLKAFNSRTCQVVLGAGAMRSAGLKNITAKHLALASQSLSIMIALIPYVRETFRRHLSTTQAVMLVEFDKLKRDYQEHQNEIHAKLIAIMGDRLSAHIKSLHAVKWDVPREKPGVNDYMELLVKETVTLHKVLSRYLSTPVVEYVMTQVFAAINHRLSEEFGTIVLPDQEAKARLLADAKFLHSKFSALKNVGNPSTMLEVVVSEKPVTQKSTPANSKPATPSANERIKGILSRRESGNYPTLEKSLPTPNPPLPVSTHSNGTPPADGLNGSRDNFLGTPSKPGTPRTDSNSGPGFKQVAAPLSPDPRRPESPLPALPLPPDVGDITTTDSNSVANSIEATPVERPSRTSSLAARTREPDGSDGSAPRAASPSPGTDS